jgi:hypothetical protein
MLSSASGLLLGLLLGMRHALEPDHLAAVSVLVARRRHAAAGLATPKPGGVPLQPVVVGMIHGLAGSGALTALVVARLPTAFARLLYIVLFGVGSAIGMACLTGLAGWPLARMQASPRLRRAVTAAAAAISMLLGLVWGWAAVRGLMAA